MRLLDAPATAARLPYSELADSIAELLRAHIGGGVRVPERTVVDLEEGGRLLVMPAADGELAITKLVTVHPGNFRKGLPTIQGEVVVMKAETGQRLALLDGATVTARRTSALSLLAARRLAPAPSGPLLVFGAGAQARAHIEAFREGLGVEQVFITSRTRSRAEELGEHARGLGLEASVVDDPTAALAQVKLIVTATSSSEPVLGGRLAEDVMVCAVGAFRPNMAELTPELVRRTTVVVDTLEASREEAGDLIQAVAAGQWRWDEALPLVELLGDPAPRLAGPILFKSVGHALFDLASAKLALLDR